MSPRQSPQYNFTPTLICEWCGQTWTPGERAQRCSRKPRTCGGKCRAALRIKEHGGRPYRVYPPELVARVRELYESGLSVPAVQEAIGPGVGAVETIMQRYNIPTRPQGQPKIKRLGERNPVWKGDQASYSALHFRVEKARGKPKKCDRCGTTEAKRYEWANLTGNYADVDDYERMCITCHRRYDAKRRKETGAPTMPREVAV